MKNGDDFMNNDEYIYRVKTISELHDFAGFEKPKHPLISVVDFSKVNSKNAPEEGRFVCEFYSINFKRNCSFHYGRQFFDHKEGTLLCTAPEQIIHMHKTEKQYNVAGWGLFFHPEFIRNTNLGKKISEYTFFSYDENEALHLSADEENTLTTIIQQIEKEYQTTIDRHSGQILVSNLELLLNYCKRFYERQFITRSSSNKEIIAKFEQFLTDYYGSIDSNNPGRLTVKFCAEKMNLSPNYFSDLIKSETGKNAQEHIYYHLLERVKNLLLGTNLTINEIACELGFEYPQSLTKLFKNKTGLTPSEYRNVRISEN
jgi:AraC-like DNA-binding protein